MTSKLDLPTPIEEMIEDHKTLTKEKKNSKVDKANHDINKNLA